MAIAQFSGLASGIDSASLIDAIIQARETTVQLRKKQIDFIESENSALEELNAKLLSLSDLVDKFRVANGGGVNKKATSSDSTVASATVSSTAANGSLSVTVTSLASNGQASFDDSYATTSTALASHATGTQAIEVLVGTGSDQVSVSANITSSTTVDEFITAFNSDADASGRIVASAVNVGTTASPSYRVVFTTQNQGTAKGQITFNIPGSVAGFGGQTDLQTRTTSQATDAVFSVSGITGSITRSSNSIGDVIPGVTLNLVKTGSATISVANDAEGTGDQVKEMVDSYNEIVKYINDNNKVTRFESGSTVTNLYGTLAKSTIDDDFVSQFRTALSTASADGGTTVTRLSEMGIRTNRDGTLSFDSDAFIEAVGDDAVGVTQVLNDFGDLVGGVGGTIYQFTKFQGFIDISEDANNSQIQSLNEKNNQQLRADDKYRENLTQQFTRLESVTADLQRQQTALSSAISSLR